MHYCHWTDVLYIYTHTHTSYHHCGPVYHTANAYAIKYILFKTSFRHTKFQDMMMW